MKYVPTAGDILLIKECAAREAVPSISFGAVLLEPGYRWNVNDPDRGSEMNIALVSDDPNWNDTDLADYGEWSEFRKGIELTEDGRGIVDLYIRKRRDEYKDLHGNISIEIRDGKLFKVSGYPTVYWQRKD